MRKFFCLVFYLSISYHAFSNAAQTGTFQFIENKGQWAENILFKAAVSNGSLFIERNSFTWYFSNLNDLHAKTHAKKYSGEPLMFKSHAFKTTFVNADFSTVVQGQNQFSNYYNFFQGDNQSFWRGHVPAYSSVFYSHIYNNIDLHVYSRDENMKYDFIVHPSADVTQIKMHYDGLSEIYLQNGNLHLRTSLNEVIEMAPVAYQFINGIRHNITCNFQLNGNEVSFYFPDGYDVNSELMIDPATLIFSSYSGSTEDNWGYAATYDNDGNLYGAGIIFGDGYPVTFGAFEEEFVGGYGFFPFDISLSKFNSTGTDLIYSTYLGGTKNEFAYSLIVNSANELMLYGATGSDDYPTTDAAYDDSFNGGGSVDIEGVLNFPNGTDIIITKFSADGSALIGSTFFGGSLNDGLNEGETNTNYGDHSRGEINIDGDDNIYIASNTRSSDIPTTAGVFQEDFGGQQDGLIAKFNSDLSTLIWCSYLGGSANDGVFSLKETSAENVIVCGGTNSTNFPTTSGVLNEDFIGGTTDGFVSVISNDGISLLQSTYIGTTEYDQAYCIETDAGNNIYITGQTSGDYPVTAGVYSEAGSSQFISKLNPDLSAYIYSTVFGSGSSTVNITPTAFLVDNCENVYVAGWGGFVNNTYYPLTGFTTGMSVTGDAFQSTTDGSDFYFIVFEKNAGGLIYATFFGGASTQEHVDGGTSRFDKTGKIYEAVCAGCGGSDNFPTTDGVWSETNGATNCNLGVIKFEFNFIGPSASISAEPANGCSPLEAEFSNESLNAEEYFWDFGDGTISTEENPNHEYTEPGSYTAYVVAIDDDACIPEDTAFITIEVYDYPDADFSFAPDPASLYQFIEFSDLSVDAEDWVWSFGDGTGSTSQNPTHQYPTPGIFTICLSVFNEFGCMDSVCDEIEIIETSILDAPNAFSPNGDGINDIYLPVNFGMKEFEIKIYNRWGQLIFYSNDPSIGWDGTYEGKDQEMDTYVYVMSGVGKDETPYYNQGNILLVR